MEQSAGAVLVRYVWQSNLERELSLINSILPSHPYVSMDTEFPREIHPRPTNKPYWSMSSSENYRHIKSNVDDLTITQLGLTFADGCGNLPTFGTQFGYIWEFNFRDLDLTIFDQRDLCEETVELLESCGVDFSKRKWEGIDLQYFSHMVKRFELVSNTFNLYWLTFSGSYDFAYLVKILTRKPLPNELEEFLVLVKEYFGEYVHDVKHLMTYCGDVGGGFGLNRVAAALGVEREVGESHEAGSDSLLTMRVFAKIRERLWEENGQRVWGEGMSGVISGLRT